MEILEKVKVKECVCVSNGKYGNAIVRMFTNRIGHRGHERLQLLTFVYWRACGCAAIQSECPFVGRVRAFHEVP